MDNQLPETIVASPGQVIGLPIGLLPVLIMGWFYNFDRYCSDSPSIRYARMCHNGHHTIQIFAFTSSPVISGVVGDLVTITTTNNEVIVTNEIRNNLQH